MALGVKAALKDTYHRPRSPVITEEAKAWVVHLACSKPKELGYAAQLWTRKSLAQHVCEHAVERGPPSLARAAKATVHRILAAQPLHPEKVSDYLSQGLAPRGKGDAPPSRLSLNDVSDPWLNFKSTDCEGLPTDSQMPRGRLQ